MKDKGDKLGLINCSLPSLPPPRPTSYSRKSVKSYFWVQISSEVIFFSFFMFLIKITFELKSVSVMLVSSFQPTKSNYFVLNFKCFVEWRLCWKGIYSKKTRENTLKKIKKKINWIRQQQNTKKKETKIFF